MSNGKPTIPSSRFGAGAELIETASLRPASPAFPQAQPAFRRRLTAISSAGAFAGYLGEIALALAVGLALWLAAFGLGSRDRPIPAMPTATPTVAPTSTPHAPPRMASPDYGVQVFLWWKPEIAGRDLRLVNQMGFRWVKQGFAWRDLEGVAKGAYDWGRSDYFVDIINKSGLKLLARLDRQPFWSQADGGAIPLDSAPPANPQDFGDFCRDFAARYRGRVQAYQVWNEPNLAREWGDRPPDPAGYARLLKACYEGIKRSDPNAIVISAGMAPTGNTLPEAIPDDDYFQALYDAGAAPYFDLLGVNAPGYLVPPWTDPAEVAAIEALGGHRWNSFRHVEDIREIMVRNGDADKQIAILEMGWTTDPLHPQYSWFAVSETQQAEYLVGAYNWAKAHWRPWIGLMNTIYIADPFWTPDDEQYWWAITRPSYPEPDLRPAYYALQKMQK